MPNNGIIDQLIGPTPKQLSLEGQPGPNFENEGQRTTSIIHNLGVGDDGKKTSEDLLIGRRTPSYFAPPSEPPVSFPNEFVGEPYYSARGGTYRNTGPIKGRY